MDDFAHVLYGRTFCDSGRVWHDVQMIGLCSLDRTSSFVDGMINEANQVLHSVLAYGLPAIVTVI